MNNELKDANTDEILDSVESESTGNAAADEQLGESAEPRADADAPPTGEQAIESVEALTPMRHLQTAFAWSMILWSRRCARTGWNRSTRLTRRLTRTSMRP